MWHKTVETELVMRRTVTSMKEYDQKICNMWYKTVETELVIRRTVTSVKEYDQKIFNMKEFDKKNFQDVV